jgi:hypothetical protein
MNCTIENRLNGVPPTKKSRTDADIAEGIRADLRKWNPKNYLRWRDTPSVFPTHDDGSPLQFDDFIDPAKDYFFGEWDAERSVVPIVARFRGEYESSLWWFNKDVRICLDAYTSFYAALCEIVKLDARIMDIRLARGGALLESVISPTIQVRTVYNVYDPSASCYVTYDKRSSSKGEGLLSQQKRAFDNIVVLVAELL